MHPVTIRQELAHRIAAIPHKGPYMNINRAFEKLGATVARAGYFRRLARWLAFITTALPMSHRKAC